MAQAYVYCSGPLFCPEETAGMLALAKVLEEADFGTFLPQRDGLERFVLGFLNTPLSTDILGMRGRIDRAIFALDVYQIVERCDYFVLNMNGRVPDEGAVAEAGIAFAVGKPIVLYKNDYRTAFQGRDNSMLVGLSMLDPVRLIMDIPQALIQAEKTVDKLNAGNRPVYPATLERTVQQGRRIWRILETFPFKQIGRSHILPLFKEIVAVTDQGFDEAG
jgi:nucleoside 2-deoxyribosyltransferase